MIKTQQKIGYKKGMMKKFFLAVVILAASVSSSFAESFENSFGVRIFGGFGSGYSSVVNTDGKDFIEMDSKPQIGFSLDNRWYVAKGNVLGLAINARWLDFSFNKSQLDKIELGAFNNRFNGLDISAEDMGTYNDVNEFSIEALNAGLIGTIAFNDHWAVDVYYNLGASALIQVLDDDDNDVDDDDDDDDKDYYFFGLNHKIGASLHIGFFQVGCEAKLGRLSMQDWGLDDSEKTAKDFLKMDKAKVGCARVFIGFLF